MPIVQLLTFASLVFLQDMCKKLRGMLTEGHPVAWWDINGEFMKKALRRGNEVVHHHGSGHSRGFPWTMATMLRTLIAASRPEDFRGARLFSGVAQRFIERILDRCPSRTPVWNHYILNLKLSEFIPDQCFLKDFGILVHWLLLLKSLFKMMYWWHPYEFDKAGQFQSYGTIRTIRRSTLRQVCGRVLVANRHILLYSHEWASFSSQDFLLLLHAIAAICFISLSHATQNSQRLIAVHFGKLTKKKRLTSTLRNFRRLSTHHVPVWLGKRNRSTTGCGKLACKGGYREGDRLFPQEFSTSQAWLVTWGSCVTDVVSHVEVCPDLSLIPMSCGYVIDCNCCD